jgi:predicted TIM-barrel fold metal-dependent hydrolase
MGNVTPTVTDLLHQEQANLARFRRALRREDQVILDDLFVAAYKHRAAAAYAGHLLPFETFLLSMQLEDHKEVMHLRTEVESLHRQVERLRPRHHE